MGKQPTYRRRKRKRSCMAAPFIMVAAAAAAAAALSLPAEAKIPQHRVKRGNRAVAYDEIDSGIKSSKFWIPHSDLENRFAPTDTSRTHEDNSSSQESWHEKNLWHLHVNAKHALENSPQQRRLIDTYVGFNIDDEQADPQTGTDLEEVEPYQDSVLGSDYNQTWNVSTEIDYGFDGGNSNSSTNATTVYSTSESDANTTTKSTFQPIRIRVILSDDESGSRHLSDPKRAFLFEEILSPAILAWSAALRVNPVVGNLTVDQSQLIDGKSCGPGIKSGHPSVLVDPEHMTVGLAETDFVVYLSLSFSDRHAMQTNLTQSNATQVNETNAEQKNSEDRDSSARSKRDVDKAFAIGSTTNKSNYMNNWLHYDVNLTGVSKDSDLYCAGDYLAAATYCSTDQNDRPTASLMHLCVGDDFFQQRRLKRNIITVMHELGHALGFNPQAMAHFRNSDGSPITERDEKGDVMERNVECAGTESSKRFTKIVLPSEKIISFTTVRGGIRVAQVVTPSVKQVVRNHFDCQTLEGAELESGNFMFGEDETPDSCIGDHWERRLFRTDLMNAIVDEVPFKLRISPITLALFADSGWYQVDLSRTAFVDGWGRGAGCSFVDDECVAEDGHIPESNEPFFCNKAADTLNRGSIAQIQGCSPDMSRKAVCSIAQYDSALPSEYQYFNSTFGANVGGNEPLLDFCPVFTGFSNGMCKDVLATILTVSEIEEFGVRNSRCLTGQTAGISTALCVPIACVVEDRTLRVQVDGNWDTCLYTGQQFSSKKDGHITRITCPDVIRACPTFHCDRSCLGSDGVCDYSTGKCMCPVPEGAFSMDGSNITECGASIPEGFLGIFFEDPLLYKKNSTYIQEDSPLADYYVPHERVLINNRRRLFIVPYLVGSALLFVCAVTLTVFMVRSRKYEDIIDVARRTWIGIFGRLPNDADIIDMNNDDDLELTWPSRPVVPFRMNKDKFVASMLVDMRVHHPQETTESLPDTSADTDSNANMTRSDMGDSASLQSDLGQDPLAPPPPPLEENPPRQFIRRRFFKSELI